MKKKILMEKMGKQYSQTPTMFRKYCVGVGEEGDLSLLYCNLIQTFIFGLKSFLFTASPHKDLEIAILQDKRHYIGK